MLPMATSECWLLLCFTGIVSKSLVVSLACSLESYLCIPSGQSHGVHLGGLGFIDSSLEGRARPLSLSLEGIEEG